MKRIFFAASFLLASALCRAQISLTASNYAENFDGMSTNLPGTSSTPAGWFVGTTSGTNGLVSATLVVNDDGSATAGSNYNYGVAGTSSVSNRALGSLASSTGSNRVIEARFVNNTGTTITNVIVAYDGEQWRDGGGPGANTLTMHISLDGASFSPMGGTLTFTAPHDGSASALDGHASSNRIAGITWNRYTNWTAGATLYLRWLDLNDSGNDDGLAIDNFSLTAALQRGTTNHWTSTSSGKWEQANAWSRGAAPSIYNLLDTITNINNKTITLDGSTVATNAVNGCMTISNLLVSAPVVGSNNTLVVNSGTTVPLRVQNAFTISVNGSLVISNGTVELPGTSINPLKIDGSVLLNSPTARLIVSNGANPHILVAYAGKGSLTLSNGAVTAGQITVGNGAGSAGTLTVAGGTNLVTSVLVVGAGANGTGTVWVTGGQFTVPSLTDVSQIGLTGVGQMTVSNGTVGLGRITVGSNVGGIGTLTLAGGQTSIASPFMIGVISTGTLRIDGGQLFTTNSFCTIGSSGGTGRAYVTNGTWVASLIILGDSIGASSGHLTISGGTNRLLSILSIANTAGHTGAVWVTGGQLEVTNSTIIVGSPGVGRLTISNGVLRARSVCVATNATGLGVWDVAGGTSFVSSNLNIGRYSCSSTAIVNVVAGTLAVTNAGGTGFIDVRGGTLNVNGGTLLADVLHVTNACARLFVHSGSLSATVTNLPAGLDADGDGLPNSWESSYGINPFDETGNNGASGDPDGDGLTNLQEFLAGSNPLVDELNNRWIDPASGSWTDSNKWSAGVVPISSQTVYITNVNTKAVDLDASVAATNRTIRNLFVSGGGSTTNTLQLSNAGTTTPLSVLSNCVLSAGGRLTISNSALNVGQPSASESFYIDGSLTIFSGQLVSTNVETDIGKTGSGSLTVNGGAMFARNLILGRENSTTGTVTMTGGSLTMRSTSESGVTFIVGGPTGTTNAFGSFWLKDGTLDVTASSTAFIGANGGGQMTMSNGTFRAFDLFVGAGNLGKAGTFTMAGGTTEVTAVRLSVGYNPGSTGTVWVTGGQLLATNSNVETLIGGGGHGWMIISNGDVRVSHINIASNAAAGGQGTLEMFGGSLTVLSSNSLVIGKLAGNIGTVKIANATLSGSNASVIVGDRGVATLTLSNSPNARVRRLLVGWGTNSLGEAKLQPNSLIEAFEGGVIGGAPGATGKVTLADSTLLMTNSSLYIGTNGGYGELTLGTNGPFFGVLGFDSLYVTKGKVTVTNGTVSGCRIVIGGDSCGSTTGTITVTGGKVTVSAHTDDVVVVNSGTLTITNKSTVNVSVMVVTNCCGTVNVSADSTFSYRVQVINPICDTDGDGLPNGWEQQFGLDPFRATGNDGPTGDPDGDGINNAAELAAGSNPIINGQFNNWISTISGLWQDAARWSNGVPALSNSGDAIGNTNSKTVTINVATPSSSLTISNLIVAAYYGLTNTLLLDNAGTTNPLHVLNAMTITSGGAVIVTNSVLEVGRPFPFTTDAFKINGSLSINSGQLIATNVLTEVGSKPNSSGSLTINGGNNFVRNLVLGNANSAVGTLTVAGGTLTLIGTSEGSPNFIIGGPTGTTNAFGAVWVTGGTLIATNTDNNFIGGNTGSGQITVSNGTFRVRNLKVGSGTLAQAGTLTIAGGTTEVTLVRLSIGYNPGASGTVWVVGGTLIATNAGLDTLVGQGEYGRIVISNGTFLVRHLELAAGEHGQLIQTGGQLIITGTNTLSVGASAGNTGNMDVSDATIDSHLSPVIIGDAGTGHVTLSNTTFSALSATLARTNNSEGWIRIVGGTFNVVSNVFVGSSTSATGTVWLGGEMNITNGTLYIGNGGVARVTLTSSNAIPSGAKPGQIIIQAGGGGSVLRTRSTSVSTQVGSEGALIISNGTMEVYSNMVVGQCAATFGQVDVAGGDLFVTNATGSAVLDVQNGALTVSSGSLVVNSLVATTSCAFVQRTGTGTITASNIVLSAFADMDGDGINNGYEISHGLDPFNAADAGVDSDGDGFTNLQEFQAGTDATNSASLFAITGITTEGINLRVTWTTVAGRTNALERSAGAVGNFNTNNFAAIFSVTNATGATTNYLDIGAATNVPAFYYRVRLVP